MARIYHLDRKQYGKMEDSVTSKQEVLGTADIKRGIFQGDSLSPLQFVIIVIPLSLILDSKGHKRWLPTQERRMQDQSPDIYG